SKAGVESREDLRAWRPRRPPQQSALSWLPGLGGLKPLLGVAAVGATSAVAFAVVASGVIDEEPLDPDEVSTATVTADAGSSPPESFFDGYHMLHLGNLFESLDGTDPVLAWEVREAAVVVTLNGPGRMRLKLEHVDWMQPDVGAQSLQAIADAAGKRMVLTVRGASSPQYFTARDEGVIEITRLPGLPLDAMGEADFRPVLLITVQEAHEGRGVTPRHHVTVGDRGQLFVSREGILPATVLDARTLVRLDTRGAQYLGRLGDGDYSSFCDTTSCTAAWNARTPLHAPWTGHLRCSADGFLLLEAPGGGAVVQWKKRVMQPGELATVPACSAGEARAVSAGDLLGSAAFFELSAYEDSGPLSVGISVDGQILLGTFALTDTACPCLTLN
ncbi:MAG: hypothetical protein ACRDHF_04645, partial [Tepidiformaceae bacterium]